MKRHDKLFAKLKKKQVANSKDNVAKADIFKSSRFKKQQQLADDPSRRKAAICSRRAGKSWCALSIALEDCLRYKNREWLIVGLTRPSIKRIYWRVVKKLNEDLELGLEFNETELLVKFNNGSILYFLGAENTSEIEKIRGNAYDGVIIDECKSFGAIVFAELIEDVIEPTLAERRGTLILIGTPGRNLNGPFYESTCIPAVELEEAGRKTGKFSNARFGSTKWNDGNYVWSSHHWTAEDNEAQPQIWEEFKIAKENRGWSDSHPTWLREYQGCWVSEHSSFVYRYSNAEHSWKKDIGAYHGLPDGHNWYLVMGIDLGVDDPTAIVLWAYSDTHPTLYNIYSYRYEDTDLNVKRLANLIREIDKEFGEPEIRIADRGGLGKLVLNDLAENYDIYCEAAEKKEKQDHIELFNTDLIGGLVRIEKDSLLAEEMTEHKWTTKKSNGKRIESDETPNDCCDAALYSFRYCYHKRAVAKQAPLSKFSEEWYKEQEKLAEEALIQREREKLLADKVQDRDWWM